MGTAGYAVDGLQESIDSWVYSAMRDQKSHFDKQVENMCVLTKDHFQKQEAAIEELRLAISEQGGRAARQSQFVRLEERHDKFEKMIEDMTQQAIQMLPAKGETTPENQSNASPNGQSNMGSKIKQPDVQLEEDAAEEQEQ